MVTYMAYGRRGAQVKRFRSGTRIWIPKSSSRGRRRYSRRRGW